MAESKSKQEPTIDVGLRTEILEELVDGVNTIASKQEVAFEWGTDGLQLRVKDAGNVALLRQGVAAEYFEHYDVERPYVEGYSTRKIADLLSNADADTVTIRKNWDTFKTDIDVGDIHGQLGGIDPETIDGSPVDVPVVKDDLPYVVEVTMVFDKLRRAAKVVDTATDHATFRMGGDDGIFTITGKGDVDEYSIDLHTDPAFEWRSPAPDDVAEMLQSNDYLKEVATILPKGGSGRFVAGPELPYHIWAERAGCIATKILQAPRLQTQ